MFKKRLSSSEFSRNVFTLVKGTSIAEAIPILISPILTRIYTPDELGTLAYVLGIVAVLAVIATGRYEMAVIIPESDQKARHVLVVALSITFLFCLFLTILGFIASFFPAYWPAELNSISAAWLWIPLLVLVLAVYQSLYYWYNRKKEYRLMSGNRVLLNALNGLLNIIAGLLSFHLIGLVVARFFSQAVSNVYLFFKKRFPLHDISKRELKEAARSYIRFPRFLVFAHALNSLSLQLPIFMVTGYFGAAAAGLFSMAQRVVMTPLGIVSNSIGDVFRQEGSEQFIKNGNCRSIYLKTLKKLFLISFFPFLVFYFVAPFLFAFVFGDDWAVSGDYARILTLLYFMQFITKPLTNIFLIAQKQRSETVWQIILFTTTVLSFFLGHYYFDSVLISLTLFSISRAFCYLYALVLGYYFSLGK